MSNEREILNTALKHAAEIDRRTVSSLTESILRDWLARHGFLALPKFDTSGAAAINHNTAADIASMDQLLRTSAQGVGVVVNRELDQSGALARRSVSGKR
jgi:hypothetical protein